MKTPPQEAPLPGQTEHGDYDNLPGDIENGLFSKYDFYHQLDTIFHLVFNPLTAEASFGGYREAERNTKKHGSRSS